MTVEYRRDENFVATHFFGECFERQACIVARSLDIVLQFDK